MRKKEIENRLNNIISNSVPNVLDDILLKCNNERKVNIMGENVKNNKISILSIPKLVGVLGVIVLSIGVIFGLSRYNNFYKVDSIVNFDVNPSIEIELNKNEDIIRVNPLNKDAEIVLDDMDFKNVDLDVAVNAIIGSMLKNGYISNNENSILVSVKNNDVNRANEIKEDISSEINDILSASSINASIMSLIYDDDDELEELAVNNNISLSKAKLISDIISANITDSKGRNYSFDSLAKKFIIRI